MDPCTEQRRKEEVLYLHSLWHQSPSSNPNPNHINPNPNHINLNPNPNLSYAHHSIPNYRNALHFNHAQLKPVNKIKKKGKKSGKKFPTLSEFEWPCEEVVVAPTSSSGWPIFNSVKLKCARLPNAEEQALLDAVQVQQKALKVTQEFFAGNEDSDGGIDSDDDSDDDDIMDEDGNAPFNFFAKVFEEDGELRGFYEKNNKDGEFSCLVCGGIWEKIGKRFKNCVALVQHSVTIAKTKKRKAHRAYSQVICKVLGWDIKSLPPMPLTLNKRPDESKGKAEIANNNKDSLLDNVDLKDPDVNEDEELPSSTIPETSTGDNMVPCEGNFYVSVGNIIVSNMDTVLGNYDNGEANLKEKDIDHFVDVDDCIIPGITDNENGDMMLCEGSLKVDDAYKYVENSENGIPSTNGNSSRVVNHVCGDVAKMTVSEEK